MVVSHPLNLRYLKKEGIIILPQQLGRRTIDVGSNSVLWVNSGNTEVRGVLHSITLSYMIYSSYTYLMNYSDIFLQKNGHSNYCKITCTVHVAFKKRFSRLYVLVTS